MQLIKSANMFITNAISNKQVKFDLKIHSCINTTSAAETVLLNWIYLQDVLSSYRSICQSRSGQYRLQSVHRMHVAILHRLHSDNAFTPTHQPNYGILCVQRHIQSPSFYTFREIDEWINFTNAEWKQSSRRTIILGIKGSDNINMWSTILYVFQTWLDHWKKKGQIFQRFYFKKKKKKRKTAQFWSPRKFEKIYEKKKKSEPEWVFFDTWPLYIQL